MGEGHQIEFTAQRMPMEMMAVLGGQVAGNIGDYAFGNMSAIINQFMMQPQPGNPPASAECIAALPEVQISQAHVEANPDCAVCKEDFSLGETVKVLPCDHRFHSDCILPWLGQSNSCPVCRYELPTSDPDYEQRRQQAPSQPSPVVATTTSLQEELD